MARLGAKVSRSEVSSIPKNTFSVGIFWRNRPHTTFLGLIGYMVRSGAKLFRTKTLLNFASQDISNSFFPKNTFLASIFVLNHTSSIFLAKRTRWQDWGQMCPGARFHPFYNTFSVWIFVLNHTSPIFLPKQTRWRDWGQKCPGARFHPSKKTRFRMEFFDETGPIPLFWA